MVSKLNWWLLSSVVSIEGTRCLTLMKNAWSNDVTLFDVLHQFWSIDPFHYEPNSVKTLRVLFCLSALLLSSVSCLQAEWSAVARGGLTETEPHAATEGHEQGQSTAYITTAILLLLLRLVPFHLTFSLRENMQRLYLTTELRHFYSTWLLSWWYFTTFHLECFCNFYYHNQLGYYSSHLHEVLFTLSLTLTLLKNPLGSFFSSPHVVPWFPQCVCITMWVVKRW